MPQNPETKTNDAGHGEADNPAWFYEAQTGELLVNNQVESGSYQLQTRRPPQTVLYYVQSQPAW